MCQLTKDEKNVLIGILNQKIGEVRAWMKENHEGVPFMSPEWMIAHCESIIEKLKS